MRKIAVLGTCHPLRGGLAAFNERISKAYIDKGNEVVNYNFKLQYPKLLFPGKTQYSDQPAPENLDIRSVVNSIDPFNWLHVGNTIKNGNHDLLITKFWLPFMAPCLGTINRRVGRNDKTKRICIVDNIIPHEKRIGDKALSNYFVNSIDGFITMSKSVLEDLNQFDKSKPKLFTPHPLYDNFGESVGKKEALEHLDLDPSFNYVLFFGFIRDYKGLDILLEAFSSQILRDSNIKLIIAGEFYSNEDKYLNLIQKWDLKDKLIMRTDFIPNDEVRYYFCASDMIVQPYHHATQSGVTQICYHFNKPMLVTNVGGLAEIVPHEKVGYVTEVNVQEVTAAIYNFYEKDRESEFIEGVKDEKQKYTWDIMLDKIDELLQLV